MPKRENPFGDSSPLQLKSHISKKEVDMGVNSETNMAAVYAKTKNLLFEGSKKQTSSPMKQIPEETIEETDKPEVLKVLPGQKKLDSWGTVSPVKCRVPTGNGASANGDMDCQPSGSGTGKKEPSVSHMKQLLFDANGKLCLTEKAVEAQKKFQPSIMSDSSLCGFCDRPLICGQTRDCENCEGTFCQLCSMLNYNSQVERSYCLQCAK